MSRRLARLAAAVALAGVLGLGSARAERWENFHTVIWQAQTPARYAGLRRLGVDGAMVFGFRGPVDAAKLRAEVEAPLAAGMRLYVENVATDFYAAYHRWLPEHPEAPNWLFLEAQRRLRADPGDTSVFIRTPSLSDPVWLGRIARRMAANGRAFAPYRPLYYSLGDETGIADLAAAWDFDRAPASLAAFRVWLGHHYPTLAALNAEWGSDFSDWDSVVPPTTSAALARRDGNEAAWLDFRSFMDEAFAAALRVGTDGLHEGDPHGLAGIEGTQAPGPGGYDYSRLAHAVDVMEMYGAGNSVEIARSFNPRLIVLTTGFGGGPAEQKRIWHSLLLGARGLILWDGEHDFVDDTGVPGPRAEALAPLLRELDGGLGAQLIVLHPAPGPVAVLYSPRSQHLEWLLARRGETTPWYDRTSETEWKDDNPMRRAIAATVATLTRLGLTPRFVTEEMLAQGVLSGADAPRALVLPQALALGDPAADAIAAFQRAGGVVVADGVPGLYDGHGRKRAAPALAALSPVPLAGLAGALGQAGIGSGYTLDPPDRGVAMRVLRKGGLTVLALEQDDADVPQHQFTLHLPRAATIRDLRSGAVSSGDHVAITLDAVAPTLLALTAALPSGPVLAGPEAVAAGEAAVWRLSLAAPDGAPHAVALRVFDPSGGLAAGLSGVRVVEGDAVEWRIALPANAAAGRWRIEATDILSGKRAEAAFTVRAP